MAVIIKTTQVATQENILLLERVNSRVTIQEGDEVLFPIELEFNGLEKAQLLKYSQEEFEDILSFISTGKVLINEIELDNLQNNLHTFINDYMSRFKQLIVVAKQAQQSKKL